MKDPKPTDMLTATCSFRLTDAESSVLAERARREDRTVSNLVRLLLRNVVKPAA